MQRHSKVFRTQDETKSSLVMNLDVKSCQAKCGWGHWASWSKTPSVADVFES